MKSTIINMADRMKDAEDRMLESLFASDPVADDGFSVRLEKRIRRQVWLQRLLLPFAVLVGGVIAFKPLVGLVTQLFGFATALSGNVSANLGVLPTSSIPHFSTILMGGVLAMVVAMASRLLED